MPQLPRETIKDRAARLRTQAARAKAALLQEQIGTVTDVLVELDGVSGHAENFGRVTLAPLPQGGEGAYAPNTILRTRITAVSGDTLIGVPA